MDGVHGLQGAGDRRFRVVTVVVAGRPGGLLRLAEGGEGVPNVGAGSASRARACGRLLCCASLWISALATSLADLDGLSSSARVVLHVEMQKPMENVLGLRVPQVRDYHMLKQAAHAEGIDL